MNKFSLLAAVTAIVTLSSASIASAQTPKFEVAGGYAYLHETDLSIPAGWFGSVGGTLNDWVGIVGAVSGHYKTQTESGVDVDTQLHTFVAGPKFASYKNSNITPYVQVLFGGSHVSGNAKVPGSTATVSVSQNGFDFQPGVGVDIKGNGAVGIRLGI